MPQYLRIAEKVYKELKENRELSSDPLENLNKLMIKIRKEIKGTKVKLLYNFIDFEECLVKPNSECKVQLDISLIPTLKNEDEFILWLASFIEKITTDGRKKLPPIRKDIPPEFKYTPPKEAKHMPLPEPEYSKSGELIKSYFNSDEFLEVLNKKPL
ncbi:hypothetical protein [Acinetobacter haemolyticus]|uniref:hypothetical protein n=1 Tax=Acinetobacter haemolyticus TaxID=29430 RepID=UPI0034CD8493